MGDDALAQTHTRGSPHASLAEDSDGFQGPELQHGQEISFWIRKVHLWDGRPAGPGWNGHRRVGPRSGKRSRTLMQFQRTHRSPFASAIAKFNVWPNDVEEEEQNVHVHTTSTI